MPSLNSPDGFQGLPRSYDDPPSCLCGNFKTWHDDEYRCFDCNPPKCEECEKPIDETLLVCVNPECPEAIGEFEDEKIILGGTS